MNAQINLLVKSLLQKDSIEQCSVQELQQYADRHPYFGAAQLLLTKKLQTDSPEQYDEQLQKTFLFFHNPLWVEHLLNDTGNAVITPTEKKEDPPVMSENTAEVVVPAASATENKEYEQLIQSSGLEATLIETSLQPPGEPVLKIPGLKMEAIDLEKAELVFEPFHTVDYFASQGIKFKEEEKPKDKFGQQLKSFTVWLKIMTRLPVTEITKVVEAKADQKVEQLAEHSLQEREVLTEAMAEVWEKQGNTIQAIEVYRKLSLLYPSKNLYFAAKIEALKK